MMTMMNFLLYMQSLFNCQPFRSSLPDAQVAAAKRFSERQFQWPTPLYSFPPTRLLSIGYTTSFQEISNELVTFLGLRVSMGGSDHLL
ncbi:hypothetical protein EVAR_53997_1 [Eumeta japonica]|uniref:Uncharacterized protein n=1 Tax=Eumeta variegata TaxID=151549 RepID=A0A4C1YTJ0_EUMVA|nr:hypothetical protein EVAR_53997_1 [Eumeta japonica]